MTPGHCDWFTASAWATSIIYRRQRRSHCIVDALDRARRVLGEKHPTTMVLTTVLGDTYGYLNQLEKAEPSLQSSGEPADHRPPWRGPFGPAELRRSHDAAAGRFAPVGEARPGRGLSALCDEPPRRESGGPKELRRRRTAPAPELPGTPTAPGQPGPAAQRPAPDHGSPRTAGVTLRRLGQTRPSRRVETETGHVPANDQGAGEERRAAMKPNCVGLRWQSAAATPLSESAESDRSSTIASPLESAVASDLPAHFKPRRTFQRPHDSRSVLD